MFRVGEYKVVFKRVWHQPHVRVGAKMLCDGRYDTVCEIYVNDATTEVPRFTGIAVLHPNDRPDKITGKKVALQKAIGYFTLGGSPVYNGAKFYNKSIRTDIWIAFWDWVSHWNDEVS